MKLIVAALVGACAVFTGVPSALADKVTQQAGGEAPSSDVPDVPGENIFGFTDPTDVGKPGDTGLASENTGRAGKRMGRYFTLQSKTELGRTLDENTWGAVSLFDSYYRVRDVPDLDRNLNRTAFDGLSFEIARRIIERSATNPFAVTFALEPRWARLDGVAGTRVETYLVEGKLLVDAVIVPEELFWAMNLNYAPGVQRTVEPGAKWVDGAGERVNSPDLCSVAERVHGRRSPGSLLVQQGLLRPLRRLGPVHRAHVPVEDYRQGGLQCRVDAPGCGARAKQSGPASRPRQLRTTPVQGEARRAVLDDASCPHRPGARSVPAGGQLPFREGG
jgi:hypothetical protein